MNNWNQYKRKGLSEMRPYVPGEDVSHVSISEPDKQNGSPKEGDTENIMTPTTIETEKDGADSLHRMVGHPGNEIKQYRPAFFEGFDNETVAFDTLEELLKIPWVANFGTSPNFHQFSASNNALMAEYRGGREWWVCGFLKNPVEGLPKWNHGLY